MKTKTKIKHPTKKTLIQAQTFWEVEKRNLHSDYLRNLNTCSSKT